jgi:hypothetical protein
MQTTITQGPQGANSNLTDQDLTEASSGLTHKSDYLRYLIVEKLNASQNKDHLEQILSFIDAKDFSSLTHDSRVEDKRTVETTVVSSGTSTLTIQLRMQGDVETKLGFIAIVTLQEANCSEVKLSVGDDQAGVAFENSELRLLEFLRTYAHQVARETKREEIQTTLGDISTIDPHELEDITLLSEQDFCERFPGEVPPSSPAVVAQARYRGMDVYVYQSRRGDGPDDVCYQLLASQEVMKFTGNLAGFKSSSNPLVRIEQDKSSALAKFYESTLDKDKAKLTMKVLAEAEELVIKTLRDAALRIELRDAAATADEEYFRNIQQKFDVFVVNQHLGYGNLEVTLPEGWSTSGGAVLIKSQSGDIYPFYLSAAASANVIKQVTTARDLCRKDEDCSGPRN